MSTFSKIAGLILVSGGVTEGGIAYGLISKKPTSTIEEIITKAGRTILKASSEGWDIKFDAYSKLQKKVNITGNNKEALSTWCTGILNKPFKDDKDENYLQAKQVCTSPTNREKLSKESKALAVETDWQGIADKYKSEGVRENTIPNFGSSPSKDDMKNWCNNNLDQEILRDQSNYKLTLKWCTKDGR